MPDNIVQFPADKVKPASYENMENNILPYMSREQKDAEKLAFLESLKIDVIKFIGDKIGRPVTPGEVSIVCKDKIITLFELNGLPTMKKVLDEKRLDLIELLSNILSGVSHVVVTEDKGKVYVKTTGGAPAVSDMPVADSHPFLKDNVSYISDYQNKNIQNGNINIPIIDLDQRKTG